MMTAKADDERRLVIPGAKPGQVYAIHELPGGGFTLNLIRPDAPHELNCRLIKEGAFTVALPGQPIDERAIDDLLADFP